MEQVSGSCIAGTKVKSVTIPSGCKLIFGFGGNTTIETINLNEGLESIETYTFHACTGLKNINLPSSLTVIEDRTFEGCTALDNITIPASVTKIGNTAFEGCSSLKNLKLNDGLIKIGAAAFSNCDIRSLSLPSTLVSVDYNAFFGNKHLTSLTVPASVTEIGSAAFRDCGLESVKLHSGITAIENTAFSCESLKTVEGLTENQTAEFWTAFTNTPWQTSMINDEQPFIVSAEGKLSAYVGSAENVIIPDSVKIIGEGVFASKSIKSVTIPETVTRIEYTAFLDSGLLSVTIPASVTAIGEMAFANCKALKEITFEYSEKNIVLGKGAFQSIPVTKDSVNKNGRTITNFETGFNDTVFVVADKPVTTPAPAPTAVPSEKPENAVLTEQKASIAVAADKNGISITAGDKSVDFTDAQPFIDKNGRTQIPIRAVAETLGCTVDWNEQKQTATLTKGNTVVVITIGEANMQVGTETVTMDTTAQIVNDRTYIPVRFVGEALGMEVNWIE
ncbi:MAG: leucine-rich repeat protein [Candidatus Ornithomonoglobus sp.]